MRSGTPAATQSPIPNLVRISLREDTEKGSNPIPSPGLPSRAAALNSAPASPSPAVAKKGDVTPARWNKHYLIPKANAGNADPDPISSFAAPDWVLVSRDGPQYIASWDTTLRDPKHGNFIIGRYAYAVYDEGGLLDVNVAGFPSALTIFQHGRKGSLAFADLTSLGIGSTGINNLIGWRNLATAQPSGDLEDGFTFSSTAANNYFNSILANTGGFLEASRTVASGRTDQAFAGRQQMIDFSRATGGGIFTVNALPYLTHFTREAEANTPQWRPATPDAVNPDFQTLRVTSGFPRSDGSAAQPGEPLVKSRFLLQRLNWLTYKGPSADRTVPSSAPASTADPDYDMWLLTSRYDVKAAFLQQGTAANIKKYFGLVWNAAEDRLDYVGAPTATALAPSIANLGTLQSTREPNFFELLQGGILNASLGISAPSSATLPTAHQQSKTLHLLTIGSNLIAQTRCDSYPVRIAFNNGGTVMEAIG